MDLLAKLEGALEGIVEGVFSRAFKAPLQPIEVAKRLTREMENHRSVSVNATYVPNVYTVQLAPETYETFQAMRERFLTELEQYLRDFAREHQYHTVGPMAVVLDENASLKGSDSLITVTSLANAVPSGTPVPPPMPEPLREGGTTAMTSAAATALEVVSGGAQGQRLPLAEGFTIGRGATNTLALSTPGVSRRHADIVRQGTHWVLRDLGSTNGLYVNNKRITTHILHPGDMITVGDTVLKAL